MAVVTTRERLANAGLPDEITGRVIDAVERGDVDAALDAVVDIVFNLAGFTNLMSAALRGEVAPDA